MQTPELRITHTNSADDSKGKTWGLDGNLFWYLAGGAFISVVLLLVLFSVYKLSFSMASCAASLPLVLAAVYVFCFRQGKPPRYDVDCLEYWLNGRGFGPQIHPQLQHPASYDHV